MEKCELVLLLAKMNCEFNKEFKKRSAKVIHAHHETEYIYLIKRPKLSFTYTHEWNPSRVYRFDVEYIETEQDNQQWFYGYTTEYGHNVYMSADTKTIRHIQEIYYGKEAIDVQNKV